MRRLIGALAAVALFISSGVAVENPAGAQDGETFRIVVIPDTQIYAQTDNGAAYFTEQTQWIADTAEVSRTVFVSHVGDVVQDPQSDIEWDRVEPALVTLESASLPYGISPGNHDLVDGGGAVVYDERFGTERFAGQPWFGGNHEAEGNRSSFQTVSIDGHELLFLHLRHLQATYGDVDTVLAWADSILAAHPDHLAFVTTHEFTAPDNSIVKPALEVVLSDHCTVAAVFSGHRFGAATGEFTDRCGRSVRHVLTNYQGFSDGGQGFLRTVDIDPYTLDTSFSVYSPTLDQTRTDPAEAFTTTLSPLVPVWGDVNCDRTPDVLDSLFITQYEVQVRVDVWSTCPLRSPRTQINAAIGDFNRDGIVDVLDALMISQCEVGVPNVGCPA